MGDYFIVNLTGKKTSALKINSWDFDKHMNLSVKARTYVSWWTTNSQMSKKKINHGKIDHVLYTIASNKGWSAHLGNTTTGGQWSVLEE